MKKKIAFISVIVVLIILVFIFSMVISGGSSEGLFGGPSSSVDSISTDVTYQDEGRNTPIGANINYEVFRKKVESYKFNSKDNKVLKISLESDITSGQVYIQVKQNSHVVTQHQVQNKSELFSVDIEPNTDYVIDVVMEKGKGSINLKWME
jgi:hypothetical protein